MADGLLTNKSIYIQGQFDNLIYINTDYFYCCTVIYAHAFLLFFSFLFLITFSSPSASLGPMFIYKFI